LDDLEHQNIGFCEFLGQFWIARLVSRAEITIDRPGQATYEIFGIEH